jgi:hypothetical protein
MILIFTNCVAVIYYWGGGGLSFIDTDNGVLGIAVIILVMYVLGEQTEY